MSYYDELTCDNTFLSAEEHRSLYSSAAAKIDLLHDAFSQLSVGESQVPGITSAGSEKRDSTDEGLDGASFLLVEVCDASMQTSLQGSFGPLSQSLYEDEKQHQEKEPHHLRQSSHRTHSSRLFSDESGHEESVYESSFRTVEVVDVSLQTTLPYDEAELVEEGKVGLADTSGKSFCGGAVSKTSQSASFQSPSRQLNKSNLFSESSFLQVEVVDASMQADFSVEFPDAPPPPPPTLHRDNSFSIPTPKSPDEFCTTKNCTNQLFCMPNSTLSSAPDAPLPKPFVPYLSPTGSPSLFSPKPPTDKTGDG